MSEELALTGPEKEHSLRQRDNAAALARIRSNRGYDPFGNMVPEDYALEAEPLLVGTQELTPEARARACVLLEIYASHVGRVLTFNELAKLSGFPNSFIRATLTIYWPSFYKFNNLLARAELESRAAEVDRATLQAAVQGNSKDRELYYKLTGRLKTEGRGGGGTIVFLNDQIQRPTGEVVVDGRVIEASRQVESVEPAGQDTID